MGNIGGDLDHWYFVPDKGWAMTEKGLRWHEEKWAKDAAAGKRRLGDSHCLHCDAFMFWIGGVIIEAEATCKECGAINFFRSSNIARYVSPPATCLRPHSICNTVSPSIQAG